MAWTRLGGCCRVYSPLLRSRRFRILGVRFLDCQIQYMRLGILLVIVIVITFYSPSCLGQETAKGPFGLRVNLPPANLSTTHGGGFTLSL